MEVKPGYKQTEVGVIPEDWLEHTVGELIDFEGGSQPDKSVFSPSLKPGFVRLIQIRDYKTDKFETYVPRNLARRFCTENDIMIGRYGPPIFQILRGLAGAYNVALIKAKPHPEISLGYAYYFLIQEKLFAFVEKLSRRSSGQTGIDLKELKTYPLPLPPTLAEQEAIAEALSDADALIESLEQLLVKKRLLKQGAMQELLTGKKRLPGFRGEWEVKTLEETTNCLDNLRVPLNEAQREKMRGDYPYCGANGVLDFVDDYVIDDDIILIAEDGGYFDEYAYRPIAYRMTGKCWVNNHAHILKAKVGFDQGFVFYSLVHKNILNFLASGTRAKLNKSEMNKIQIELPSDEAEQTAIAATLSDMDAEITALETKLTKTRQLKQGMMQELLTGRIRLV